MGGSWRGDSMNMNEMPADCLLTLLLLMSDKQNRIAIYCVYASGRIAVC